MKLEKSNINSVKSIMWNVFGDTTNQVLMDLYINFQDNTEDAKESRSIIRQHIYDIVNSFEDDSNYIYPDVKGVLNFILDKDSNKPTSIPDIFKKRLNQTGRKLSVHDFYLYR